MDQEFLNYYNDELKFIREMSAEFAHEFPKVAGRLNLDPNGQEICPDPFVERLLEGFAFLTARVRQKHDSEFPRWTQAFFESVYPTYLSPVPSMGIVQFHPQLKQGDLATGVSIPKGSLLRSKKGDNEKVECLYKTGHPTTLYPLSIEAVDYYDRTLDDIGLPVQLLQRKSAGIKMVIETTCGDEKEPFPMSQVSLKELDVHISGNGDIPVRLLEYFFSRCQDVVIRPLGGGIGTETRLKPDCLKPLGLNGEDNLIPHDARIFEGFRLLREYFSFPKRVHFFRLSNISQALQKIKTAGFEVIFLFDQTDSYVQRHLDRESFNLFCVPVINLFKKRLDRINLSYGRNEYLVVPDKTKPYDFEVYSVQNIKGIGRTSQENTDFFPFYRAKDGMPDSTGFYTSRREMRKLSVLEERNGRKSSYLGTNLWISLVDERRHHLESELRQLSLEALCTNRHLPLGISSGDGDESDFEVEQDMITRIVFKGSPTAPKATAPEGEMVWRMINFLHANYHSLIESDAKDNGKGLRDLMRLFLDSSDLVMSKQIEALENIESRPITRRLDKEGPASFARGYEIRLIINEQVFGDSGIFTLGQVLAEFLNRYVMINSFVETVLVSKQRGIIKRWPAKSGQSMIL